MTRRPRRPSGRRAGQRRRHGRAAARSGRREGQWKAWAQRYGRSRRSWSLFVYNAIDTPFFLTRQSLLFILLRQAAPIAIVAVGMAIVIGTGGIDLSVGSVMAIAGQVGATLVLGGHPFLLAIVAALLGGGAVRAVQRHARGAVRGATDHRHADPLHRRPRHRPAHHRG